MNADSARLLVKAFNEGEITIHYNDIKGAATAGKERIRSRMPVIPDDAELLREKGFFVRELPDGSSMIEW